MQVEGILQGSATRLSTHVQGAASAQQLNMACKHVTRRSFQHTICSTESTRGNPCGMGTIWKHYRHIEAKFTSPTPQVWGNSATY